MKKIVAIAVAFLFLVAVGSAFAASKGSGGMTHRNTGCGLGALAWGDKADNSVMSQTSAATTNATFYSQLFGITSGTSGCEQPTNFAKNDRLNEFVVANMDNLAKDIAKGSGESLETFAELMQVPADKRPEFYKNLQTSFAKIYTSENVVLANVVDNVAAVAPKN
jgi:hypothetical protein